MISVSQLHFAYSASEEIFHDFNLSVKKGSLFGLVGPNGAGKSTLISLLTGLHTPQSGTIEIAGKTLATARYELLSGMSLVPQEYAFYPRLTVLQNLNFFCRLYKNVTHPENNIHNAIRLTGLEQYQSRAAGKLSGGLKRRLNLAIGLLNKPDLLILDEPTVGIDPQSRHFILSAIKQLNKEGMTILYTSHYMEEVEDLCDTIAVIDHGKILIAGTLDTLLTQRTKVKIKTEKQMSANEISALNLTGSFICNENSIEGELDDAQQLSALLTAILKLGHVIESVEFGKQSLESVYFALTDKAVRE